MNDLTDIAVPSESAKFAIALALNTVFALLAFIVSRAV